jgi:hypothetical protein
MLADGESAVREEMEERLVPTGEYSEDVALGLSLAG